VPARSAAWQKIDLLNATLRMGLYDVVLLIDGDACFVPWNGPVLDQLLVDHSEKDIIFVAHCTSNSLLCAGVLTIAKAPTP
jgi:hypothetical protein